MPYQVPFYIKEKVSNNAFHFEERKNPELYVPSLKEGNVNDVAIGQEIVFEDVDDNGILQSCTGLENFLKILSAPVPTYIFDNHNHAFYFWCEEFKKKTFREDALLIHVDQHKDNRIPPAFLDKNEIEDLEQVFKFTNTVLNVGNFIPAAQKVNMVKEVVFINSEYSIENFKLENQPLDNVILDIDLDFFAPEFDYISNALSFDFLKKVIPKASVITIATSPFFIDQTRALEYFRKIAAFF